MEAVTDPHIPLWYNALPETMQSQQIKITKLRPNKGQIEGLPKNPRIIRDEKFSKLVNSIKEDPEMLELRELIVFPHEKEFVVVCGNMRLRAMMDLGYKDAPCKVLGGDTSIEKLKAYTIKDNVPFGEHDWSALANEWDSGKLADWGLDAPGFDVQEVDAPALSDADKPEFQQMTFTLHDSQAETVKAAMDKAKAAGASESDVNENSNGNALAYFAASFLNG